MLCSSISPRLGLEKMVWLGAALSVSLTIVVQACSLQPGSGVRVLPRLAVNRCAKSPARNLDNQGFGILSGIDEDSSPSWRRNGSDLHYHASSHSFVRGLEPQIAEQGTLLVGTDPCGTGPAHGLLVCLLPIFSGRCVPVLQLK